MSSKLLVNQNVSLFGIKFSLDCAPAVETFKFSICIWCGIIGSRYSFDFMEIILLVRVRTYIRLFCLNSFWYKKWGYFFFVLTSIAKFQINIFKGLIHFYISSFFFLLIHVFIQYIVKICSKFLQFVNFPIVCQWNTRYITEINNKVTDIWEILISFLISNFPQNFRINPINQTSLCD